MKKKVLFALIALFSFLSTWAQTVDLGGNYKASFAQGVTFNNGTPYVLAGAETLPPQVSGFTVSSQPISADNCVPALGDPSLYKVVKKNAMNEFVSAEAPLAIGNYFLQFQIVNADNVTTLYVPFQVYGAGQYVYVYDETSYEGNLEEPGLANYYTEYPWSDLGKEDGDNIVLYQPNSLDWFAGKTYEQRKGWWNENGEGVEEEYYRNWNIAATHPKTEPFPWIVLYGFTANDVPTKPCFKYNGMLASDNSTVYPWGDRVFGGEDGKMYGVASVSHEFNEAGWAITAPNQSTTFQVSQFEVLLVPADQMPAIPAPDTQDRINISNSNVSLSAYTFNGQVQKPVFTSKEAEGDNPAVAADATVTYGTGADAVTLVEGQDFTVAFPGSDYINAGNNNKPYTITGIGLYKGTYEGTYSIARVTLTAADFWLNPAGPTFTYDGSDKKPTVEGEGIYPPVQPGTTPTTDPQKVGLVLGTDFTAVLTKGTSTEAITEAKNVGEYTYTINPSGNYTSAESITKTFEITPADLSNYVLVVPSYTYNTKTQKPVFTGNDTATPAVVADAFVLPAAPADATALTEAELATALVEDQDYTVTYADGTNFINAGTKNFTIAAKVGGNYTGQLSADATVYTIAQKNIADNDVTKNIIAPTFTGDALALKASNFDFSFNETPLVLTTTDAAGDFTWALNTDAIDPADYESDEEYQQALEDYETSAGDKVITVTGQGNYFGTANLDLSMKQFIVTITTADATKVYGQPDPKPNFTVDANSATQIPYGGEEWQYIQGFLKMERYNNQTNAADIKENVGGHDYIIVPNPEKNLEECNYQIIIQNNTGILKIEPAPLTVKIAQNTKIYGNPDPDFTADKGENKFQILSGETDVTTVNDFVDATKKLKDVLNIDREEGEDVKDSPYAFTWDNPNYDVTFKNVPADEINAFTITPKNIQIEITWDPEWYEYIGKNVDPIPTVKIKGTDTELTYETDFQVAHFDGDNGNTRRDVTVGNNQDGNRWPKATVSQVEKGNYQFATATNQYYKITPATLKVEALTDNYKSYGESDPTPLSQVTFANGFGPKGTDYFRYNAETGALETNIEFNPALVTREAGEHVGNYEISINPAAKTRNYVIESTAKAKFHIYLSEETIIIAFDKKGSNTTEITYEDPIDLTELISVTAPTGVTTADLLAYAQENVKKYQLIDPETGEIDNVNGEKTYIDGFDAGTYTLTIDDAPTAFKGYPVVVNEGTLVIQPYPLYIRAVDSKEYGDKEPVDYAWSVYEWKKVGNSWKYVETERTDFTVPEADNIGNTDNGFQNRYRYTISRAGGEAVGHYTTSIRPYRYRMSNGRQKYYGTQYDGNYSFEFAEGDFEITRRDLTVTVTGASKFYGELDPAKGLGEEDLDENEEDNISIFQNGLIMIQIENALPSDLYDIASKVNYGNRAAGEVVTAGYQVNNVTFDSKTNPATDRYPNYNLTFDATNVKFMINQRVLKVTAHDQSVPYTYPIVIDPYDLTVDGIIIDGIYQPEADINYDDIVTFMTGTTNNPKINDKVTDVFKPLTSDKTSVGTFHKNAFNLDLTDAAKQNYKLEFTNGKLYIEQLDEIPLGIPALATKLGVAESDGLLDQVLKDHDGKKVNVLLADRGFFMEQWYCYVLPFDIRVSQLSKKLDYAVVNMLDPEFDGGYNFQIAMGLIPANTPFLVKVADANKKKADVAQVKFADVEIKYSATPVATDYSGDYKFIGTYVKLHGLTANEAVIRNSADGEAFQPATSTTNVRETEAYLSYPEGSPFADVRIFIQEEDGTVTAINGVDADVEVAYGEGWYTITGVKLDAQPTTAGTYIFNGKKVYIK